MFTGLFMEKMVGFLKLYFPVFLLGAVFGKLIEVSGFSKSIVAATIRVVGAQRAMLSIVLVCALLTYGGVSLFVVVFAVYPFAAELFRRNDIPKRLIPGTIAPGAFTFTMDALPGTPQIQNIIPAAFFGTTSWAAPVLGTLGGVFILAWAWPTWNGAGGWRCAPATATPAASTCATNRNRSAATTSPIRSSRYCRCCWSAWPTSCSPAGYRSGTGARTNSCPRPSATRRRWCRRW